MDEGHISVPGSLLLGRMEGKEINGMAVRTPAVFIKISFFKKKMYEGNFTEC